MHSIHKVGLLIAGLATALAIGGAFVAQGYIAARQAADQAAAQAALTVSQSTPAADVPAADTPAPGDILPPQVVYIAPVPSPQVVTVRPPRPAAGTTGGGSGPATTPGPAPTPPVIHITVTAPPEIEDVAGGDN